MIALLGLVPLIAAATQAAPAPQTAAPTSDPTTFLKWSMDKYKAMKSYRTNFRVGFQTNIPNFPLKGGSGVFVLQTPNRYKLVSWQKDGPQVTEISDGTTVVGYTSTPGAPATKSPAPPDVSTSDVNSQLGQLGILPFFGGSANLPQLADTSKKPITFGDEVPHTGSETVRNVLFYGKGPYGNLTVGIGEQSGTIYTVSFDMAPEMDDLKKMFKDSGPATLQNVPAGPQRDQIAKLMKDGPQMTLTTEFLNVQPDSPTAQGEFATTLPKGVTVGAPPAPSVNAPSEDEPKPPVPVGHKAPDFMVTQMDGKSVRLSSLRGHVVMLDFWATWCGPCKASLPETYRLSTVGAPVGLKVLPISDEDHGTVAGFLKANHYSRPTFLDAGSKTEKLYNIQAIPTVVIIDAKGKLRNYFVGAQDPDTLKQALKKAGARI